MTPKPVFLQSKPRPKNHFLANLPEEAYAVLAPELEQVEFRLGQTLSGATPRLYFPETGLLGRYTTTDTGDTIAMSCIGSEGFTGINTLLGSSRCYDATSLVVDAAGSGHALKPIVLMKAVQRNVAAQSLLNAYIFTHLQGTMQLLACARSHSAMQRMARCLLRIADRAEGAACKLPVKKIAEMTGLSLAAAVRASEQLRMQDAITITRERISLRDRAVLEHLACSCYHQLRSAVEDAPAYHQASNAVDKPRVAAAAAPTYAFDLLTNFDLSNGLTN